MGRLLKHRPAAPRLPGILALAVLATAIAVTPAWCAEGKTGASEAHLIGQIILLIVAGRLLGEAMLRLGQPAVMGQLIAGILLGPSVLGALWPEAEQFLFPRSPEQKAMLDGIAQFGILLLLLLAGMETELALVRDVRRAAFSASLSGIALPFACGLALGFALPDSLLPDPQKRVVTALFLGTALSISSVKIVASVVRDMGFMRRNVGQVILASAIIDDTVGWIIIAITFGLAGQENFNWLSVLGNVGGTLLFLAFSFTLGRRLVFKVIQFSNDHFRGEAPVIAAILVVMGTFALITQLLGVHTVLGAFVAGILVGESPILTEEIDRQFRGLVAGLFMPVFFGLAGLSADLTVLKDPELALLTLGLIAIASFGKAAGAFTGGWFGGLTGRESTALAMGMNARGSTEVIVATIGLSIGVLSHNLFTMIVAMAVITTTAMPPTLRWALRRLPMRREEKARLERELYERNAFMPNLERILLAVDGGANGRFASRLAGLLAAERRMPVTVLDVANDGAKPAGPKSEAEIVQPVMAGAEEADTKKLAMPEVDVIVRKHDVAPAEAIATEAERGYDLLMIGVEEVAAKGGGFHATLSRLLSQFEGSVAIVDARGAHRDDPAAPIGSVVIPVTGNENARRGAEVAITLAHALHAQVSTLSVIGKAARNRRAVRREIQAVAEEVKRIGKYLGTRIKTSVRTDDDAGGAILRVSERDQCDLVAMGVSRRPGDRLSFGDVADTLLRDAKCSLLFIAPQARAAVKSAAKGPERAAASD
ncbi:MAG: potassium transporter [Alphaproteobacteria bacterium]|nr:MAG: potassium transporter [Alphaproteobacteria bacterium]